MDSGIQENLKLYMNLIYSHGFVRYFARTVYILISEGEEGFGHIYGALLVYP